MPGTLIIHTRGGVERTRADLALLSTPEATETWRPVPHYELVASLIEGLRSHDVVITREQYGTSGKEDARIFGVLDLRIPHLAQPDYGMCVGFRGSNDKSLAIEATAGARVFICDNLAFSGETGTVVLRKKHTSKLNLSLVVPPAIDAYLEKAQQFVLTIEEMKSMELSDDGAKTLIYNCFQQQIMPLRFLPKVHKLYFDDPIQRDKFESRTIWSLNNSFTEAVKELGMMPRERASRGLGRFFTKTVKLQEKSPGHFGQIAAAAEREITATNGELFN